MLAGAAPVVSKIGVTERFVIVGAAVVCFPGVSVLAGAAPVVSKVGVTERDVIVGTAVALVLEERAGALMITWWASVPFCVKITTMHGLSRLVSWSSSFNLIVFVASTL